MPDTSLPINIDVNNITSSNVNDINPANNLNNFEILCAALPQQQDQTNKNTFETRAVQLLNKMVSIPETNWDRKDPEGNNMLERGLWSGSSKIMEVFHQNSAIINKFITIEKNQIYNFWRIMMESHISNTFRTEQIKKFQALNLNINDFGQDNHTVLYNAIYNYLDAYLSKYTNIVNKQNNEIIQVDQLRINQSSRIIENLLRYNANPSTEADNILNLLVQGSLQVQDKISKIPGQGDKYVAKANFKALTNHIHMLAKKTLLNHNPENSSGNNIITIFGNKAWSIKRDILKMQDLNEKKLLAESSERIKSLAEPIIKEITKQPSFNPNTKDTTSSASTALPWIAEFGVDILKECIQNMQIKPDVNIEDSRGNTALHWYSDYNATQIVKVLIKTGGNVNYQSTQNAATSVHFLFLNTTNINANKPKLPTLEILLDTENKPPFDPNIRMIGEKTVEDLLNDDTINIVDREECKKLLSDYQNWYNANEEVNSLGESLQDFNLYE